MGKADKGSIRAYLEKVTGLSRAQITRLIGQFLQSGKVRDRRGPPAKPFLRQYTPADVQLLNARRLTYLLADLAEGALLLDEATWALQRDGDARKALVARRFARERLIPPRARGILDHCIALDHFDAIVRYGAIDPAAA